MATEVKNPILTTDANERHKRYLALTSADVHIAEEELPNIAKIIIENGIRYPDRLCMSFSDGQECTFGQLLGAVSDVYAVLKQHGLKEGDKVLPLMQPGFAFYAAIVASFCLGLVTVIIEKGVLKSMSRLNHCVRAAAPKAVLRLGSDYWYAKYIFSSLREVPTCVEFPRGICGSFLEKSTLLSPSDVSGEVNALLTFTTGSTGMPKPIYRKHSFLMHQILSIASAWYNAQLLLCKDDQRPQDFSDFLSACNLPVASIFCLVVGAPCVLETNIMGCDMAKVASRCSRLRTLLGGVSCKFAGSPAFLERFVRCCLAEGIPCPISYGSIGGAPVYSRTADLLRREMGLSILYGSTEAEPISTVFADEKVAKEAAASEEPTTRAGGHCVGRPCVTGSVAVIKDIKGSLPEGTLLEDVQNEPGVPGEIVLHGWHVNMSEVAEKRVLFDKQGRKWIRMDDGGYLDKDGYIWLVGRVAWKVQRNDKSFWSIVVEEKVLKQSSLVTFVTYLERNDVAYLFVEAPNGLPEAEKKKRNDVAYLFVEAPNGLPEAEKKSLEEMLRREEIPVDVLRIVAQIPRDHRHASKPNTGVLFAQPSYWKHILVLAVVFFLLALLKYFI